jgi:hypothetical protein
VDESIFSTYRQGENRVTSSIVAVLRSLILPRIEYILGALLGEEFTLVSFKNQPSKRGSRIPDAEISAKARIFLETKTERNRVTSDQLKRHLDRLRNEPQGRVLVLTPDHSEPAVIQEINDKRLAWASFADLSAAINDLLTKEKEVVSEREEFLLRELQKMLEADKLLHPAKEVVVVAARIAWPEYQKLHAYIHAADRTMQPVKYLAFYSQGQIQATVPAILRVEERVTLQRGLYDGSLGELVQRILDEGEARRPEGNVQKIFILSAPDDLQHTIKLDKPIRNDLSTAFVQGQRYVSLDALRRAKSTSDLVAAKASWDVEVSEGVPPDDDMFGS